ncbi:cytochrome c [Tautonia plasticadhaerens]|uniref:Cytochrome C n=1 Tax=Tautonia plasticadhaerens TaxID=2527974 RepID=A0A518H1V6_9BACT|nr:cytochrome c [Tautonia plasticadhaerens]QDV34805.1 Cytochrome C' [Tautonia plasticadhaerens]
MMLRKSLALAAGVSFVALLTVGLSGAAPQEEGELHELMEKVTAANNKINRYIRTPVSFKKSQEDIVTHAKELTELGKKARENEEAIEKAKDIENPKEKWQELMDDMIEHCETLVTLSEEGDQAKAKAAHTEVKKSCAECHKVFRVEDDF